jgi:hypothetical protein
LKGSNAQYNETIAIDFKTFPQGASAEIKNQARIVSFNANKTKYSVTSGWCQCSKLYTPVVPQPAVTAAYKFVGEKTIDGKKCDQCV